MREHRPHAAIAQMVERIHGKDEVSGSIPDRGSIYTLKWSPLFDRIVEYLKSAALAQLVRAAVL